MKKLSQSLALAVVLALFCHLPLHAQSAANAPVDTASAAQAPDEVTTKITALVNAGKYAEAQQLTTGLLLAYPDDQRLIKAKALLEKLLTAGSASAVPGSNQPTSTPPSQLVASTNAVQFTGMDKVDYNSLIELARQAQQNTDLEQQKVSLQQFMEQSSVFLQKYPEQMLLWQLRGATAIGLNEPMQGYEAGERLLALGAADSNDPRLQRLLAQLKIKGWLDKQTATKLYEQQRYILLVFQGEVGGTTPDIDRRSAIVNAMTALLLSKYPSRQIHSTIPVAGDPPPILKVTVNVYGTTLSPCTYGAFKNIWKCPAQTTVAVAASLPQGWQFNKTYPYANGTSGVGWGTPRTPLSAAEVNSWISRDVTGLFKEVLDTEEVRAALAN